MDRRRVLGAVPPFRHLYQLDDHLADQGRRIDALAEGLDRLNAGLDRLAGQVQGLHENLEALKARTGEASRHGEELWQAWRTTPEASEPDSLRTLDPKGRPTLGFRGQAKAAGYRGFEDQFRGSEERVRALLRPYVKILAGHAPVLDFGCGRGEMLDLLREAGVAATGLESDASMVARLHAKGHAATCADGLAAMAAMPPASAGALFAAQVAEHLPLPVLTRLLAEARRVVRPRGLVVLETINPHPAGAFKMFFTDPDHKTMLYPEVLVELVRQAGYAAAWVHFPGGSGDLERDLFACSQYAVVAEVPAA